MNPPILSLSKKISILCVGVTITLSTTNVWADNFCNSERYNCVETFYRNRAIEAGRNANAVSSSSTSSSTSGADAALSAALAKGIASLKASQDVEVAAGDVRMKAFDEAAKRAFVPFSEADIADSRRNILIVGANDGRALRQNQLGIVLLNGYEGFQVNVEKGLFWLHKAAAQGDVNAVKTLAEIFTEGLYGVKPDYIYGFQLYETLVSSSGMPEVEQAALLMNQAIDIFKKDEESFYPKLAETALIANTLGVPAAPQVIYKLTMVSSSSPTSVDSKFKAVLETPSSNPYLIAANAVAMSRGSFGIAKDKTRGKEILKAEAELGHQPSIDILKIRDCFDAAKTPEDKKVCEPLASPFYL